jgi:hypothetical protein
MRALVVVVVALVLSSAARADAVPAGAPASSPTPAPKLNPVLCGCASSRFLSRGDVVVDGDSTVSAWLHGGARIDAFERDASGALQPTTLPLTTKREAASASDGDALVHTGGAGAGKGFLGVVKAHELTPRVVVAVDV